MNVTSKRQVFIKVSILKISDIDTLKETFSADVFYQARWREPALDHSKNNAEVTWTAFWNPKLIIQNAVTEGRHVTWKKLQSDENGETYILEKHRFQGTFSESLELALFPFDIQELSILISTQLSEDEIEILEDDREVSNVHTETFTKKQEWNLHEFIGYEPKVLTSAYANTKYKNPGIYAFCCAGRQPGFFLWNIILIMSLITSLSLATFALERTKIQNRLQLSFMLVLTTVTFKFVTNQVIPKIPYVTHLDRYVIGMMSFLYSVALWHAFLSLIQDEDTAHYCDTYAFYTFLGIFILLQIGFALMVFLSGYKRWSSVKRKEEDYQIKAKSIKEGGIIVRKSKMKSLFRRQTKISNLGST